MVWQRAETHSTIRSADHKRVHLRQTGPSRPQSMNPVFSRANAGAVAVSYGNGGELCICFGWEFPVVAELCEVAGVRVSIRPGIRSSRDYMRLGHVRQDTRQRSHLLPSRIPARNPGGSPYGNGPLPATIKPRSDPTARYGRQMALLDHRGGRAQRNAFRTSSTATAGSRRNWRMRAAKAAAASCAWRWVASPEAAMYEPARPRVSITASRSSWR